MSDDDRQFFKQLKPLIELELAWGRAVLDAWEVADKLYEKCPETIALTVGQARELAEALAVIEAGKQFPVDAWWAHPESMIDRMD